MRELKLYNKDMEAVDKTGFSPDYEGIEMVTRISKVSNNHFVFLPTMRELKPGNSLCMIHTS